jgi:lipopolysaccharide export system permease protein
LGLQTYKVFGFLKPPDFLVSFLFYFERCMKKIDKLILSSFLGPFLLTFLVVVFILLTQHMLKYFDDIIGKDLGWDVIGTFLFYFAIVMTPVALPLAVLLSCLITFGNLGEHFELTATKSLGISLIRSLFPIFLASLVLTGVAYYANNTLVPKAALEAYSLLYDIKQKKPALDLREGAFVNSIPDVIIKVNKKYPDGKTIKDVIVYDHRGKVGNKEVTVADSGKMYTILNDQYLKLELFNGYNYTEGTAGNDVAGRQTQEETYSKTKFARSELVLDLSSFALMRTDKKWFQSNRIMRNTRELQVDMDSIRREELKQQLTVFNYYPTFFAFHFKHDSIAYSPEVKSFKRTVDSVSLTHVPMPVGGYEISKPVLDKRSSWAAGSVQSRKTLAATKPYTYEEINNALSYTRNIQSQLANVNLNKKAITLDYKIFEIQWHKIFSSSLACLVMFLIGAPLGAIIKRGGLGIPVLVSILFFIVYYVLGLLGEKWAKAGLIPVWTGVWMADAILIVLGFVFLNQARIDARLFEADFYQVAWAKLRNWLRKNGLFRQKDAPEFG